MSHCVHCVCRMDPLEAEYYLLCKDCRKTLKEDGRIRTLNRPGTEQVGRPSRSSQVLGGAPTGDNYREGSWP